MLLSALKHFDCKWNGLTWIFAMHDYIKYEEYLIFLKMWNLKLIIIFMFWICFATRSLTESCSIFSCLWDGFFESIWEGFGVDALSYNENRRFLCNNVARSLIFLECVGISSCLILKDFFQSFGYRFLYSIH